MICQRTQRLFSEHINIVIPLNSGLHKNCENHCTEHRCTPTLAPRPPTSTCYLSRTMLTATYHKTHKVLGSKKKKPSQQQQHKISPTHKHSNDPKAWRPKCHDILKGAIFLLWRVRDGMRRIYTILGSCVWMLWLISLSDCNFVATLSTLLANWPSGQRLTFFLHKFQNFLRGPADFFCVTFFWCNPTLKS